MRAREFGLLPRTPRRSRITPSGPGSRVGKQLLGHHMRQGVPVFDERGQGTFESRMRAKALRRQLREELGRKPTPTEYRAAKRKAKQ